MESSPWKFLSFLKKDPVPQKISSFLSRIPSPQRALSFFENNPAFLMFSGFLSPEEFDQHFPTPEELTHHVELWENIFARYSTRQVVIHDSWYFQVVYEVVDLDKDNKVNIPAIIKKYTRILRSLARKEEKKHMGALTSEEKRVYKMFAHISEKNKFCKAAARTIRASSGRRERFIEAIQRSGLYQQKFVQIFYEHGLPLELSRLPVVESYFNYNAYSQAGAAGIWQFIPLTARLYGLRMNRAVDERYDPFKSAESAAKFLKENYTTFQSWPLAITAYNHGPTGMLKAVKQVGTSDLGKIVRTYRGPNFGFCSQNYYAQFLAVAHIMQNPEKYFGDLEQSAPIQYDEVRTKRKLFINDIATMLSVPEDQLVILNRDLKQEAIQSKTPIPKDFVLKLPAGKKAVFLSKLQEQAFVDLQNTRKKQNL
jgi:membrane-bound lytic murein transglycosylase D